MVTPESRTISVVLPATLVLNANGREHYQTKRRRVEQIRAAFRHASEDMATLESPVVVEMQLHFPRRDRRRDSPNWMPTAKAGLDGIVDSRVLDDDNDSHVVRTVVHAHDIDPHLAAQPDLDLPARVRLTLTITETT